MKFIVSIILIALLGFTTGLYFSWWTIAIDGFIVAALIHQIPIKAFFSGFIAIFLLWGFLALIIDIRNDHILSKKVAMVLPLGGSSFLLIILTALIGGLVGGLAALSGSYFRNVKM